jgi:hypothetical protein
MAGVVPKRSTDSGNGDMAEDNGFHNIVTGHAYTILGVHTFSDGVKAIKIRNPWGSEMYTGPAGDTDTAFWTSVRRAEVNH